MLSERERDGVGGSDVCLHARLIENALRHLHALLVCTDLGYTSWPDSMVLIRMKIPCDKLWKLRKDISQSRTTYFIMTPIHMSILICSISPGAWFFPPGILHPLCPPSPKLKTSLEGLKCPNAQKSESLFKCLSLKQFLNWVFLPSISWRPRSCACSWKTVDIKRITHQSIQTFCLHEKHSFSRCV